MNTTFVFTPAFVSVFDWRLITDISVFADIVATACPSVIFIPRYLSYTFDSQLFNYM